MTSYLRIASQKVFLALPFAALSFTALSAAEPTVEERLAAIEAELKELKAAMDPNAMAERIATAVIKAQEEAARPKSAEEVVAAYASETGLTAEQTARLGEAVAKHIADQTAFAGELRSGTIERTAIRERMQALRSEVQASLATILPEDQVEPFLNRLRNDMRASGGARQVWTGSDRDRGPGDREDRRGGEQTPAPAVPAPEF